jgi:hypothetical protein
MAVRKSIATGDFTAAATWGLVDATSYNNTETTTTALTTAYTTSSTFTPGAITVEGIAVKLSVRTGTTGTISVALDLATVTVTGTEVTIDTADLPAAATADLNGGWIYFKFASPVLLLAATAYGVKCKTSSAAQVSLRSTATTNWARALVTTTTGAPAAGDDLIIAGEYTAASTSATYTITMNETATTDYGAASTSLVTPALAICSKGVLTWETTAATDYNLKLSGNFIVYADGALNMGTTGTPCPRGSTMTLNFDVGVNVGWGLTIRNLGTWNCQGLSRTSGKDIWYCKLNTNEAVNQTTLGVDTDTGWLDNDVIGIASTSRTAAETERGALNGAASASSLTVDGFAGAGGGLANAHLGTSPTQAEIILLTRSIIISGVSESLQSFVRVEPTAIVDVDWTAFQYMGSATAGSRGISIFTTTGSSSFSYCSFYDWGVTSSAIATTGSETNNFTVEFCVFYNVNLPVATVATSGANYVFDNLISMRCPSGNRTCFNFIDVGGTITNIMAVGNLNTGNQINISEVAQIGTIGPLTAHSSSTGISLTGFRGGTVNGVKSWRGNTTNTALNLSSLDDVIIDGYEAFGNTAANLIISSNKSLTIKDAVLSGDSSFATLSGILFASATGGEVAFEDSTFGAASGIKVAHSSQDVLVSATAFTDVKFHNCLFASTNEIGLQSSMVNGLTFGSQRHDQTTGLHKAWLREGTITIDTTAGLYDVSPGSRLTPNNASENLRSIGFRSAVTSGNTLTVSVKVRESVIGDGTAYNGTRVELLVKRNAAAGIAADTVLATATIASEGAFETISGTTAAVTDDAILEFVVRCNGTTGWVNFDTFAVTTQYDTRGGQFWKEGQMYAYGDNSAGGGAGQVSYTYGG